MEGYKLETIGTPTIALPEHSTLQSVCYTPDALCFKTAAGICARLTHEGVKGWRLQANAQNDTSFSFLGASQALAKFLGEEIQDTREPLTVTQLPDKLVLSHGGSTSVELSLNEAFSIKLYAASKGRSIRNARRA